MGAHFFKAKYRASLSDGHCEKGAGFSSFDKLRGGKAGGRRGCEVSVRHLLLPMQIKALIKTKTLCADNQFIDAQVVLHCHFMEGNGERYVLLR